MKNYALRGLAAPFLMVAGAAGTIGLVLFGGVVLAVMFWKDVRPRPQPQPVSVEIDQYGSLDDGKLFVRLKISHTDRTRHVRFTGWTGDAGAYLTDGLGNVYHHYIHFGRFLDVPESWGKPVAAGECVINSDMPAYDCLVFEPPVPAAKKLTLELPADHFGGGGVVRLEITDWR